jgi:general secretion pathway protein G
MQMKGQRVRAEQVEAGGPGDGSLDLRPLSPSSASARGWTLIELVITITVLTVLTIGVIPLVRNSVQRQKEQRLREILREMRTAIDTFKRDTYGMQCTAGGTVVNPGGVPGQPGGQPGQPGVGWLDPRSTVVVADCKLFGVDNPDRFPPDLQVLVDGVDVVPRLAPGANQLGNVDTSRGQATDNPGLIPKKKVYLREIPVDPITGKNEWCLRSSYESPDEGCSSSPENVFDVRSKAEGTALNGEKYSDW